MGFAKGNKLAGSRKGIKNNPDLMSVKKLLEDAFIRHQSGAMKMLDDMFKNKDDFKFLLSLKASLEPKQVNANLNANFKFEHLLEVVKIAEIDYNQQHANHN